MVDEAPKTEGEILKHQNQSEITKKKQDQDDLDSE